MLGCNLVKWEPYQYLQKRVAIIQVSSELKLRTSVLTWARGRLTANTGKYTEERNIKSKQQQVQL